MKLFLMCIFLTFSVACGPQTEQKVDNQPDTIVDTTGHVWTKGSEVKLTSYPEMLARQRADLYQQVQAKFEQQEIDADSFDQSVDAIAYGSFPLDSTKFEPEPVDITVEQLAENLRGVSLKGDYEYISEPDFDLAERLLQERSSNNLSMTPTTAPPESSSKPAFEELGMQKTKCCGNDNRFFTTEPTDFARVLLSEVGCSVGLISSNVGVTAAHCVYDTETEAWLKVRHTSTTWSMPNYSRHTSAGNYQSLSCYTVTVPSCWVSASSNSSITCDYAVIDFSNNLGTNCSDTTPFGTWNGSWIRTDAQIESELTWGVGYPAFANLSGGNINGPGLSFLYTTLNGTWGSGTVVDSDAMFAPPYAATNDATGVEIDHNQDASEGDSGRPHLDYISTGNYMIGHHVGNVASGGHNIDRRFDSTVWSFIQAHSPL